MIDIAMIPRTNEPMEGEVFLCAGPCPTDRYQVDRYTWGDDYFEPPWGWRAHQMVFGTSSGAETWQWLVNPLHERRRTFSSRTPWLSPTLGGWPTAGGTCPSVDQDVLQRSLTSPPTCGIFTWQFGTCGRVWSPREGQRLPSSAEFFPKKGQCLP